MKKKNSVKTHTTKLCNNYMRRKITSLGEHTDKGKNHSTKAHWTRKEPIEEENWLENLTKKRRKQNTVEPKWNTKTRLEHNGEGKEKLQ